MDDEARATLARIESLAKQGLEVSTKAFEAADSATREVSLLRTRIDVVEKVVYGSLPPPTNGDAGEAFVKFRSTAAADIDEVRGHILAVDGKVSKVLALNKTQSRAMGLAPEDASTLRKLTTFIRSREGRRLLVELALLYAAVSAALHGVKLW